MNLRFQAKIEIIGVNPYVRVTAQQAAQLMPDWRRPMPVLVQVNGEPTPPWPINMMPMGDGNFYLYLDGRVRRVSNTGVGDNVDIFVTFNPEYQPGPTTVPENFATALANDPNASANWDALPPSRQKEIVRYLSNLKSAEAQERNIARAMQALSGQPTRFIGRDWNEGK